MTNISNFVRDMEDSLQVEKIAKTLHLADLADENAGDIWDHTSLPEKTRYRKAAAAAFVILKDEESHD